MCVSHFPSSSSSSTTTSFVSFSLLLVSSLLFSSSFLFSLSFLYLLIFSSPPCLLQRILEGALSAAAGSGSADDVETLEIHHLQDTLIANR